MSNIFEECNSLKSKLDSLRPFKKEDEMRIIQKFRLDWNYHSNNLEGNSLTYGETKALILFGITAQGKPLKDHFEVTGHNEAISWVLELVNQDRPLSENFVRELHALILKESYEVDAITPEGLPTKKKVKVGEYKTSPNHVKTKTGEIFRFATPEETPILMNKLIEWYNQKSAEDEVNPILLASEFHYRYIKIHPFDDGNGRTARILMNFILLRFGYPPVIIKTEDKHNYFAALRQADAGTITSFIEYIANNLKHSLELMISGANGESIEEEDDLEKEISLLEQSVLAVGQHIKISKDKESLLQLFEDTIAPLFLYFLSKSKLMNRFYYHSQNSILISTSSSEEIITGRKILVKQIREKIRGNTSQIDIYCDYESFKATGFQEFDLRSTISFDLNKTTYVASNARLDIKKEYGKNLTVLEINSLVDEEIKRHKEHIQQKLDTLNKK